MASTNDIWASGVPSYRCLTWVALIVSTLTLTDMRLPTNSDHLFVIMQVAELSMMKGIPSVSNVMVE
jgi:hypothetical protein